NSYFFTELRKVHDKFLAMGSDWTAIASLLQVMLTKGGMGPVDDALKNANDQVTVYQERVTASQAEQVRAAHEKDVAAQAVDFAKGQLTKARAQLASFNSQLNTCNFRGCPPMVWRRLYAQVNAARQDVAKFDMAVTSLTSTLESLKTALKQVEDL